MIENGSRGRIAREKFSSGECTDIVALVTGNSGIDAFWEV
jgi:hypothetical protein